MLFPSHMLMFDLFPIYRPTVFFYSSAGKCSMWPVEDTIALTVIKHPTTLFEIILLLRVRRKAEILKNIDKKRIIFLYRSFESAARGAHRL